VGSNQHASNLFMHYRHKLYILTSAFATNSCVLLSIHLYAW